MRDEDGDSFSGGDGPRVDRGPRQILPLLRTNLSAAWLTTVAAVDASESGIGICRRTIDPLEIGKLGRASERWRFQVESAIKARESAMKPQEEPDPEPTAWQDVVTERAAEFHEVPDALLREADCAVAVAGSVDADRNILELEGCAAALGLRHLLRDSRAIGKRLLILGDNLPVVLGVTKGRARSPLLRAPLQAIAAMSLATGSR
jgi:hypothetical protein